MESKNDIQRNYYDLLLRIQALQALDVSAKMTDDFRGGEVPDYETLCLLISLIRNQRHQSAADFLLDCLL